MGEDRAFSESPKTCQHFFEFFLTNCLIPTGMSALRYESGLSRRPFTEERTSAFQIFALQGIPCNSFNLLTL
jgi:hypothetical protein